MSQSTGFPSGSAHDCHMNDIRAAIPLRDRKGALTGIAVASLDDYDRLMRYSWYRDTGGYACTKVKINGKWLRRYMHSAIAVPECMESASFAFKGMETDHINHDRRDNRRSNLRHCTHRENCWNAPVKKNKTGYPGVVFHRKSGKYMARIRTGDRVMCLGYFPVAADAGAAYQDACRRFRGEFANV